MRNREQDQEMHNRAYELRLRGRSWRQIGSELGIGHETARRWVQAHMENVTLPLVEEVRKQEVDRLMRYLDRLEERIDDADDKAMGLALKISERLCKMLGADMPTQVQVEKTEVTQVDLAIRDMIAAQQAQNALRKEAAESLRPEPETDILSADLGDGGIEAIVVEN